MATTSLFMITLLKYLSRTFPVLFFVLLPSFASAASLAGIPLYDTISAPASSTSQITQPLDGQVLSGSARYARAFVDYTLSGGVTDSPILLQFGGASDTDGCIFGLVNASEKTAGHHADYFVFVSVTFNGSEFVDTGTSCDLATISPTDSFILVRHVGQVDEDNLLARGAQFVYLDFPRAYYTAGVYPTFYNLGFEVCDSGGCDGVVNNGTRIIDFTPEEASTTGSIVTFSIHVYINPADIGTFFGVLVAYQNIDQNKLLSYIPFITQTFYLFQGNATTSGDFYYTATTTLPDGNYRVQAKIERTILYAITNPFASLNDTQNHQFVVNNETYLGHLRQQSFRELNALFASTSATSTIGSSANCNPVSWVASSTNISLCLAFLFIPDSVMLADTVQSLHDGVLTRAPWGYFTRIAEIIAGNGTSTVAAFTIPISLGQDGTTTLTYDPMDMIAGGGAIVNSLTDNQGGHTLRSILEPFVQLTIALAVVFTIFNDLTGSHSHSNTNDPAPRRRGSGITVMDNRRGIQYDL